MRSVPLRLEMLPVLGLLALAATPAGAQPQPDQASEGVAAASSVPRLLIRPRVSITETVTDNINLSTAQQSELITRLSTGLYASSRSGRVQGFVDYSLSSLLHARGTRSNQLLNALTANGSAEVWEKRGFVDVAASITQQAINPLGTQSVDAQVGRNNQTEVRNLQITPRLQGQIGPAVEWAARASYLTTTSTSSAVSDATTSAAHFNVGNSSQLTRFGWSLQGLHTQRSFSLGRSTVDDIVRGVLDYRVNPEFSAGVIGGYESTDIRTPTKQAYNSYGLRLNWVPSVRTRVNAEAEKRFFGKALNVNISHRWSRVALTYRDTRNLATGVGQTLPSSLGTWFDLIDQQLSSTIKDAAQREQAVLDYLRSRNIEPGAGVLPSFQSSGVTVQRSQQLAAAWLGARDTLTLALVQTSSQRADDVVTGTDAFSLNGPIRQRGYSLTLGHRLTPVSNLTMSLTQTRNSGSNANSTSLRSVAVQWSTVVGLRSSVSLLGRRVHFTSSTNPYDESALVGTFGMTF